MQNDKSLPERNTIIFAWVSTLFISSLPNIIWQEFFGPPTIWLFWSKIILLISLIGLSFLWTPAKKLRVYFLLFLILYIAEKLLDMLGASSLWIRWFPQSSSFIKSMFGIQLRRIAVAAIMVFSLLAIYRRPNRFFLVPGKLDAPSEKLLFLIDKGTSWKRLSWILAAMITFGTLVFLVLAGRPSLSQLSGLLPMLPAILILAAMNAFSEELSYRAALLAPLSPAVGTGHSLLLTATYFGLAHFYGVPYGVVGVIMAFILGYLLSKAMLETKGFFWPWFIHFWQDVAIFSFMAIGSIVAGG